jgi:3',5'-cyclic AMP phosphodiesterase CpdA
LRIVHLTDLHYFQRPPLRSLLTKRALGLTNLVLGRRAAAFGGPARDAVIGDAMGLAPDLAIVTGDVTTLATPAEFAIARAALEPLLDAVPTVMMAGNHDRYTRGSHRQRRTEGTFGAWMGGGRWDPARGAWRDSASQAPYRFDVGPLTVVALDTARPHPLSRGRLDGDQLRRLEDVLIDVRAEGRTVLLALHYPVLTRQGTAYRHPGHGLAGVSGLIEVLRRHPVAAVLHGHDHHHRVTPLPTASGTETPVINGGSSGLAPGEGRDPGYYVLDWEPGGPLTVRRRRFDGDAYRWTEVGAFTSPTASAPATAS